MTVREEQSAPAKQRRGWIHFGIAAAFLALVGFGWNPLMGWIKWVTHKEPVPWPVSVEIDQETFRNVSFPEKIGPYEMIQTDSDEDGQPDGDRIVTKDILSSLKIGTMLDSRNWEKRQSNWYMTRFYQDTREGNPFPLWGLDVYYYTGAVDTVPHVPEVCGQAGGAAVDETRDLPFRTERLPDAWRQWDHFSVRSITLESIDSKTGIPRTTTQYYVFSVNGDPLTNRHEVRLKLGDLRKRYVYFAKIQWYPLRPVQNSDEADESARDFLRVCLPDILRQLPPAEELQRLDAAADDSGN